MHVRKVCPGTTRKCLGSRDQSWVPPAEWGQVSLGSCYLATILGLGRICQADRGESVFYAEMEAGLGGATLCG